MRHDAEYKQTAEPPELPDVVRLAVTVTDLEAVKYAFNALKGSPALRGEPTLDLYLAVGRMLDLSTSQDVTT